jgi:hypothetical protein
MVGKDRRCCGGPEKAQAFTADYTPWPGRDATPIASEWLQLAQQRDTCCKHCTKGKPCGNTCIAASSKCKQPEVCMLKKGEGQR